MSGLIAVADTHLTRGDPETDVFVGFLRARGARAGWVVHLGDLFNVWLGRPRFEMDHMRPVLDAFRALRRAGVKTALVEGNREFHVRRSYEGDAFDRVATGAFDLEIGPRRLRMSHGDLVNVEDRPYRAWRRFARSGPVWAAVGLLPSSTGIRLAEGLEARLRGTNMKHKTHFPERAARRWAEGAFEEGRDLLLVGHFHEERVLREAPARAGPGDTAGGRDRAFVVVPDWRSSRRYLEVEQDGSWRWGDWAAGTEGDR